MSDAARKAWRTRRRKQKKRGRFAKKVAKAATRAENKGVDWLKGHKFRIIRRFYRAHPEYYDVIASKSGKKWMIDIKSGHQPPVKIDNLLRMLGTAGVERTGLLFVPRRGVPVLLELNKMRYAGLKASKTKGKKAEREAAKKAVRTKRREQRKRRHGA